MNSLLRGAIDDGLASLTRVMDAPSEPFGYGTDVACATDIEVPVRDVDPSGTEAVSFALLRRIDCPRGQMPDDGDYGFDLRGMLNRGITQADLAQIGSRIRSEWAKDDRVSSAAVVVTQTDNGASLRIVGTIVPASSSDTFRLVISATSAVVVLEAINA